MVTKMAVSSEARKPSSDRADPVESPAVASHPLRLPSAFFLITSPCPPSLPVIDHVFLHGHARNGAADHVESQVLQRFEADATFTHIELLAALLVFAGEPG